jgi:hypothetical protein
MINYIIERLFFLYNKRMSLYIIISKYIICIIIKRFLNIFIIFIYIFMTWIYCTLIL